jgi:hypothetical protein
LIASFCSEIGESHATASLDFVGPHQFAADIDSAVLFLQR